MWIRAYGGMAAALGARLARIKARPLGRLATQGEVNGAEEAGRRQLEDARPVGRPRRGQGDRRRVARAIRRSSRLVRAGDPDRARGARGSRLRDRRPGRPRRRQGRPHRLHLGGDAARRRRAPDHRRPQRAPRRPARKRRRGAGQGRSGARLPGSTSSCASARASTCARPGDAVATVVGAARRIASRRCRPARPSWPSPTSRSGRSAPARSRPIAEIAEMHAALRAAARSPLTATRAARCGFSTAARSRPRTRPRFSRSPTSTARWSAAPA